MTLVIRPDDLSRASDHLRSVAARLDDARDRFARSAAGDLPDVGAQAGAAATRGVQATDRAVEVLVGDLDRLGRALAELALYYPSVDRTAVAHPR
jgi:hypothetical protein